MARKCFILACAIAMAWASAAAYAQEAVDVVYLKNGSVIRGTILELVPDVSVKIETKDRSLFVFKMAEVERIAKERVAAAPAPAAPAAPAPAPVAAAESTVPLSNIAIIANPLGFLQFGPFIKAEIKIGPNLFFTPYLRLFALGAASQAITLGDADTVDIDLSSLGIAGGIMRFFPTAGTPNGLYTGVLIEYNWITATRDKNENWENKVDFKGLVVVSNVGYRWRAKPLTFSLGGILGAYFQTSNEWWYTSASYKPSVGTSRQESPLTTMAFGMLEASIGYEL